GDRVAGAAGAYRVRAGAAQDAQWEDHAPSVARTRHRAQSRRRHEHSRGLQRDRAAQPAGQGRRRDPGTNKEVGGVMARITQLRVHAPHAPGTLAQICTELAKVAVNINGIMAAPEQPGGIRILASPLAAARKTLDQLGLAYEE